MNPTPPIPSAINPPQDPHPPAPPSSFILPPSSFPTPLSPDDHATLLAIVSPDPNPEPDTPPDPVLQAAFLARPDIQPHLAALAQLRALRDEITHQHRMGQAADLLLEIARKAEDIVEKRRAADALVRLLLGPSNRRARTDNRSDNRTDSRTDSRTHSRSDTRTPSRPPSHAAPPARPTSTPAAPPPMPPLPDPLPDSFLALLPPDHPLRQPSPKPHPPTPAPEAPPPFTHTFLTPPGLDPVPSTPHNHPPATHALTLAAGAPQSNNT
ncbi:MAG: hypothetical protein IT431_16970, partial [Phycisphaerales bacterium]|nr:hypothetical protein [Phycisphaerales bacterium]